MLLVWFGALAALPLVGERGSTWHDVEHLVRTGQVHEIRISGELAPGNHGFSTVYVRWHRGGLDHVTVVLQATSRKVGTSNAGGDHVTATLYRMPSEVLRNLQPALRVSRDDRMSAGSRVLGFEIPSWLIGTWLMLSVAGVSLLVGGPQPWWATRWAWLWLGAVSFPIAGAAFLLLSGPTPGVPKPQNANRRLTGGWAFLIAFLLGAFHFT